MNNVLKLVPQTRICTFCNVEKAITEFNKSKSHKGGHRPNCRACCAERQAEHRAKKNSTPEGREAYLAGKRAQYKAFRGDALDFRKNVVLTENGRTCLDCGVGKAWDEFAKDAHGYNEKTANCKACRNIKGRQVYKDNPAVRRIGLKNRPDKLKRVYGVTWQQIERTLAAQFGLCANIGCSKEISLDPKVKGANRAVIDHCHTTGKFRAVLCSKCNLDLGMIETNEARFLGLMDYKNKYNQRKGE